jgi:GTP-binding protein YchF
MKAGLVGYAQTGKTTLFNALTGQNAQTGGGGGKAKSNLGVIKVPDERIAKLTAIYKPKKTAHAEVLFVDVPGPRTKGSGIDGATIQALQEMDALAVVLRGFTNLEGEGPQPARELVDFEAELLLNDQLVVERRLERLAKEHSNDRQKAVLSRCLEELSAERPLRQLELSPEDEREISSFAFLSKRPLLAVVNTSEQEVTSPIAPDLIQACQARNVEVVSVCASLEAEIAALASDEQAEFLAGLGISEPASAKLIRAAYALLDYISFFTVGEDEVKAWTVRRGAKAPQAAGRIHSDIERGFIRAEVMAYDQFVPIANEAKMRELGKLRVEGKEYIMKDGDIVNFRFAV